MLSRVKAMIINYLTTDLRRILIGRGHLLRRKKSGQSSPVFSESEAYSGDTIQREIFPVDKLGRENPSGCVRHDAGQRASAIQNCLY